jgi:hypothetical protein
MRRGAVLLAVLALAACSHEPVQPSPPVPGHATAAPPASPGFEMVAPAAPPEPAEPADPKDMCGSAKLRYLVGRPKTEIPVPVNPSQRRVACTTCPLTMDYSPMRLNILFDEGTGIVKEVKCG